jgi:hypothetical protein
MAVHYSCAPDVGCMWHPKHVEQKNCQEKEYCTSSWISIKHATKIYGTTDIK